MSGGGMGRIFRGRDRHTGAPVAVKLVAHGTEGLEERFAREAAILAEVRNPGIVRYVAHGTRQSGERYLVMEWLEGLDFADYLAKLRASQTQAATVMESVRDLAQ